MSQTSHGLIDWVRHEFNNYTNLKCLNKKILDYHNNSIKLLRERKFKISLKFITLDINALQVG